VCSKRFEAEILWKFQKLENVENWKRSKNAVNKVKGNFKRRLICLIIKLIIKLIAGNIFLKFLYLEV